MNPDFRSASSLEGYSVIPNRPIQMKAKFLILLFFSASLLVSCTPEDSTSPIVMFAMETAPKHMFKGNLDASASFSLEDDDFLEYRWDLNGDHLDWESEWLSSPRITFQFPFSSSGFIGLQVRNSSGNITELYQGFYTAQNTHISDTYTDLEIDFRNIRYDFFETSYIQHLYWAFDNIQLPSSDAWFNFSSTIERSEYGSMMAWDVADTLDQYYNLPSRADWQKMIDFCGGTALAGFNLQVEADHGLQLRCPGIIIDGQHQEKGQSGYYWTGEEHDANSAYALKISVNRDSCGFVILDKSSQVSVRLFFENSEYFN